MQSFSKFLEVNNTQLFFWIKNKSSPSPEKLLQIAKKLNCTIYDIISGKDLHIKVNPDDFKGVSKNSTICKIEMESHLRSAAYSTNTPKSLSKVCKDGNFSVPTAKRHFPKLSQIILEKCALNQKESIIQKKKDIEVILKTILTQQIPQSLKKSLEDYGLSVRVAQKYQPELSKIIVERNQKYINELKERRIKSYEDEIKRVIYKLFQEGIFPSRGNIIKKNSNPNIFLNGHFRTFRMEILKSLGYINIE